VSLAGPTLGPLGRPPKAIGHESPIELWLAPDHRSALRVSETDGFVVTGDKGRRQKKREPLAPQRHATESMARQIRTDLALSRDLGSKKNFRCRRRVYYLPRHSQRGAICVALLLLSIIDHLPGRAVSPSSPPRSESSADAYRVASIAACAAWSPPHPSLALARSMDKKKKERS
jgi:hypothetical protein